MMADKQAQEGKDNSINLQAAGDINVGLNALEVKQIALDVYKANFIELTGVARATAEQRVNEITERIIHDLSSRGPEALNAAIDPDFQNDIYTVQKEYARSGEKELGDVLVDILGHRSTESTRSLVQIVLNESLSTAPKLTVEHFNILSLVYLLRHSERVVDVKRGFQDFLTNGLAVLAQSLEKRDSTYQHLVYCGCGSFSAKQVLEDIFLHRYTAFFWKGIPPENLAGEAEKTGLPKALLMTCFNNPDNFQYKVQNDDTLEMWCKNNKIENLEWLKTYKKPFLMKKPEVKEKVLKLESGLEILFQHWNDSEMGSFSLTSVGIAIAHANLRRRLGVNPDLKVWIN